MTTSGRWRARSNGTSVTCDSTASPNAVPSPRRSARFCAIGAWAAGGALSLFDIASPCGCIELRGSSIGSWGGRGAGT